MTHDSIYNESGLDLPLTEADVIRNARNAARCQPSNSRTASLLALMGVAALGAAALATEGFGLFPEPATEPASLAVAVGYLPIKNMPSTRRKSTRAAAPAHDIDARTVDLMASEGSAYFVTLEVGNPPRPFRVHLDTGSSSLFIPATYKECATCDPHFDRSYDSEQSTTSAVLGCADSMCGACTAACGNPQGNDPNAPTALWLGAEDTCRATTDDHCTDCAAQDTCAYKADGVCDDGSQGGKKYCDLGTDSADCDTSGACCGLHCCSGTSASCAFQASYGDESGVAGKLVQDTIAIGTGNDRVGASSYMGVFNRVHSMSNGGLFEEADLDGIFGIAGNVLNEGNTGSTVLDDLLLGNGMRNLFGLCFGGLAGGSSAFDVGTVDPQKFVGDLIYVPFQHDGASFLYYDIDAPHKTTLGEHNLKITPTDYGQGRTIIVDSGTTLLLLATEAYTKVVGAIEQAGKHTRSPVSVEQPCFQADASYNPNSEYPTLQFWLTSESGQEFALELAPQHYLGATTQAGAWCLGIGDGGSESIFGDIFMEAFYTSFDRDNFVVGFAPVSDRCGNHVQNDKEWPIYGCTDESFLEFDSGASAADMSACRTKAVEGCLDPNFVEFSPGATRDTVPTSCCTCREGAYCSEISLSCPQKPGGPDSCKYAFDGECDEPTYCLAGTDTTDCSTVAKGASTHIEHLRRETTTTDGLSAAVTPETLVLSSQEIEGKAMTTYQLALKLNAVTDVYAIYGDDDSPLTIPAAFQVAHGADIGGMAPALMGLIENAELDSWLTIGVTDASRSSDLRSIGADWSTWTADSDLSCSDCAIFYMVPEIAPRPSDTDTVIVGQLTVAAGVEHQLSMNAQGHRTISSADKPDDSWAQTAISFTFSSTAAAANKATATTNNDRDRIVIDMALIDKGTVEEIDIIGSDDMTATPAWVSGDAEPPAGSHDTGGWTMAVFTDEQQARLKVNAMGHPTPPAIAAAVACKCVDNSVFENCSCAALLGAGVHCGKDLGVVQDFLAGTTVESMCPLSCGVCSCPDEGDELVDDEQRR